MRIGAIIRSTGERTERLCHESVKLLVPEFIRPKDIHIVRDQFPFWKAVEQTIHIAQQEKLEYFFALDADIVLRRDCAQKFRQFRKDVDFSKVYRVDFPVKDRFTKQLLFGVHFYNGSFCEQILEALEKTKLTSKPEGDIKKHIKGGEMKATFALGYHGYEQYHTDIFNRFIIRAYRNPEFVKRYEMFQREDDETKIAKFGWQYGLILGECGFPNLNALDKVGIEQFGYSDIPPLEMNINTFHTKWSSYVP
jgi:hypothetical protein